MAPRLDKALHPGQQRLHAQAACLQAALAPRLESSTPRATTAARTPHAQAACLQAALVPHLDKALHPGQQRPHAQAACLQAALTQRFESSTSRATTAPRAARTGRVSTGSTGAASWQSSTPRATMAARAPHAQASCLQAAMVPRLERAFHPGQQRPRAGRVCTDNNGAAS
jgi:hypothetical protein